MAIIFVTGFHRAGTHTAALELAKKHNLPAIAEESVFWDCLDAAIDLTKSIAWTKSRTGNIMKVEDKQLDNGFILQCPGLAHETLELAKYGKVVWCDRNKIDIINSMKHGQFNEMTWHLMKQFKETFPDDEIWRTLSYDGAEDRYFGFIKYHSLFVKVKQHFYEKVFKGKTEYCLLEDQPYFDSEKERKACLKPHEVEMLCL